MKGKRIYITVGGLMMLDFIVTTIALRVFGLEEANSVMQPLLDLNPLVGGGLLLIVVIGLLWFMYKRREKEWAQVVMKVAFVSKSIVVGYNIVCIFIVMRWMA